MVINYTRDIQGAYNYSIYKRYTGCIWLLNIQEIYRVHMVINYTRYIGCLWLLIIQEIYRVPIIIQYTRDIQGAYGYYL